MFDWVAGQYFEHMWKGKPEEQSAPSQVQEYFKNEPYTVLVDHAITSTHASIKELVNAGQLPTTDVMATIGRRLTTTEDKQSAGWYLAWVAATATNGAITYGGSTNNFSSRIDDQHEDPDTWAAKPDNALYLALKSGRVGTWNCRRALTPLFFDLLQHSPRPTPLNSSSHYSNAEEDFCNSYY